MSQRLCSVNLCVFFHILYSSSFSRNIHRANEKKLSFSVVDFIFICYFWARKYASLFCFISFVWSQISSFCWLAEIVFTKLLTSIKLSTSWFCAVFFSFFFAEQHNERRRRVMQNKFPLNWQAEKQSVSPTFDGQRHSGIVFFRFVWNGRLFTMD